MLNILRKNVVGVDLHDHVAQLVELSADHGSPGLVAYNRVLLPDGVVQDGNIKKAAELKALITDLFEQATPKKIKTKHIALILPSKVTFVHIFHFPASLKKKEIKKAIPFQAETIIPFPIDEVYWDFSVVEVNPNAKGGTKEQAVLFAAVLKETADKYVELFESIGITPNLFAIHPHTLALAMNKQVESEKTNLIIEMGELSTNYLLMEGQTVKAFFSSNQGSQALMKKIAENAGISEAELFDEWEEKKDEKASAPIIRNFIDKTYVQAVRMVKQYVAEGVISSLDNIFLTGEFSNIPYFYDLAKEKFTKQNVEIGDPKLGLTIDNAKFMAAHEQKGGSVPYSIYFTNAIGAAKCALYSLESCANLLPDKLKKKFFNEKVDLFLATASVVITIFCLIISGIVLFKYQDSSFNRLHLEAEKAGVENTLYGTRYQDVQQALSLFNSEVAILSSIDSSLVSVPLLLEDIYELLPAGVLMNAVQFNDEALSVKLIGVAVDREQLLQMQGSFEEAKFVSEVNIPLSNFDTKTEISFAIELTLNFSELPNYGTSE